MMLASRVLLDRIRDSGGGQPLDDGPHNLAPPAPVSQSLLVLLLFVGLTALHTWPLASGIGTLSRHDNGDAMLNEWAVAWVAHQIVRNPLHLFDANIFYPEPNTLAFSEHMFVQGLMGAPLLWAGVPTLVVHNLLILAGFALSGWTMALVMRRRTGAWSAGILAGMLLAFNAHTLSRIAHLQAVHVEFIPLTLFALDRLLTRPRVANALRLAGMYALQGLTSNYLLVFMTFGLAGAGLVRLREWTGRGRWNVFGLVCLAGAVAVLILSPFLIHYLVANQQQGLTRSLEEVRKYSGAWQDYFSATGNIHYNTWSRSYWRVFGAALFPGVTALLLSAVALGTGVGFRHPAARMWLALGLVGFVLSFGAHLPGYSYLYNAVPLLQGIRATVRFGFLLLAAIAALAAFGLTALQTRFAARPRLRMAITALALVAPTVEALRIPVGYSEPHHSPALYKALADQPDAVLVELPLYEPSVFERNAPYMLHATLHWRPLVNGYSGFMPESYRAHYEALRHFPDEKSIAYLRRLGVTHVAVHPNGFQHQAGQEQLQAIANSPDLRPAITAPGLTIYKVRALVP